MHPDKHTVFIVCGEQLALLGITLIVNQQPGLEVIGTANDHKEAVPLLRDCAPKVVILYAGGDQMETATAIFRLKVASPQARLLVMGEGNDVLLVCQFLKAGASGYILTTSPSEELAQAVKSLVAGGNYLAAEMAAEPTQSVRLWQAAEPGKG